MKKQLLKIYLLWVVLIFTGFTTYLKAETEPNNDWRQANPLIENQTMNGTMSSTDTEDWYKIVISENVKAEFTFKTDSTLKVYYLRLYNEVDNTIEQRNYAYYYNYGGTLTINDLAAGTYYLKIGRGDYQGAYTLSYSTTGCKWANDTEPNDDYEHALEMQPDTEYAGQMGYFYKKDAPDRDVQDWYKIEITKSSKAEFTFETDSTLKAYYLRLYNEANDTIEQRNYQYYYNYGGTLTINDLAAGTYYLKIDRGDYQGAYTLSYSTTGCKWANDTEPNDDYLSALEMQPDTEYTGQMGYFYKKDAPDRDVQDWYKIEITENVKAEFTFETDSTLKVYYLRLYDAINDTIEQRNYQYYYNYGGTMTINDLAAGTYYLKIDRGNHQGAYKLRYSTESPDTENDLEPNNKFNDVNVKTLLERQPATGQLGYYSIPGSPDMDVEDWYKVEIQNNCKAEFTFETDSTLKVYYLRLYNEVDNTIEQRNYQYYYNYGGTMTINDLAAGTYYLKIDRGDYQGAYTLSYSTTGCKWANDTEPNNDYEKALEMQPDTEYTGQMGYFYKKDAPDRDVQDWYKIEITENSKAEFTFETDSTLKVYHLRLYNEANDTIEQRNYQYYYNYGGTMTINDLAAGTYYLKIDRGDYQGAYTLSYSTTGCKWANDTEPNNDYEKALEMQPNTEYTGQMGYFYKKDAPDTDVQDWYKIEITENSKAEFTFETDSTLRIYYLRLYNEANDTIEQRNYQYYYNYGGTMTINDLAAGTYYLKIDRGNHQGAYTLSYSTTRCKWANDTEPNDDYLSAFKIKPDTVYTGQMGYFYKKDAPNRDVEDWYKVVVDKNIKAEFTFETDSTLRVYYLRLYNEANDTIEQKSYGYYYNYGGTLTVNDLAAGTYYLKIDRGNHQGAYKLTYGEYPHPIADFTAIQELNTSSFVNKTQYGKTYQWDFGDGNTSELANPTHSYAEPGVYDVKLTATNDVGKAEIVHKVSVRGIQRIESNRGGAGGKATISIFGGGLKSTSTTSLTKNGAKIAGTDIKLIAEGELSATFDLTNATQGVYNIVVKNSGEEDMGQTDAFTVEPEIKPEIWTDIQGRDKALIGRWQTYTLTYGNKGNVDSKPQVLWIVTPDDPAEVDFKNITIDDVSKYPESIRENLNSGEMYNYMRYDSIDGEKTNVRVYGIMIPSVKANSEGVIQFRVKSKVNFEVSTFVTESFFSDMTTPQQGKMLSSQEYDSYESCVRWTIAQIALDKGLGFLSGQLPGASCVVDVVKNSSQLYLDYQNDKTGFMNVAWTIGGTAWTCAKDFVPILKAAKMTCQMVDLMIDIKNNYDADAECKKYKKKKKKKKKVRTVYSFDPNEMVGPTGYKAENFVSKTTYPYTILFENKESATAPAQEVVVVDTLDATKYDMSTFRFNEFGFGTKVFKVVQDSNKFVKNIDMRPEKNVILRVSGELDSLTNVVRWQFITLDPATMDLTEDPDGGFLPPNKTKPEGEGFVSFVIDPKEELKDGDAIENSANIFFDLNKPIMTNKWVNTIDESTPMSKAVAVSEIGSDGMVAVELTGTDGNGAGVKYLDLYIAKDDGEFEHKYTNLPANGTFKMKLEVGSNYRFYTIATDSLEYTEAPKNRAEVSLTVTATNKVVAEETFSVFPNPAHEFINIKLNNKMSVSDCKVEIITIDGRIVHQETISSNSLQEGLQLSVAHYAAGVYYLRLRDADMNALSMSKFIVK